MRKSSFIFFALGLITATIGGCVVAVTPLHKQGQFTYDDGTVHPVPQPENHQAVPAKEQVSKEQMEKCKDLAAPVKDKDKKPKAPTLTPQDVQTDKDKVINELLDYISKQDAYITNHGKKDQQRYDSYRDACRQP